VWKGTAFGGWKSRTDVPRLVNKVLTGETTIDPFISHVIKGLDKVNDSILALHSGECIRAVVVISERGQVEAPQVTLVHNIRAHNGNVKRIKHWSKANQCEMTFSIYIPDLKSRNANPPPVLYFLAGLTCSDETAIQKSDALRFASKQGLAMIFPDTSARGVNIAGQDESWDFGLGAGFYVDATTEKWKKHYNMYTYVTQELPELVNSLFPVDGTNISITGHSMGGHGALIAFLKNPGMYKSVSAFAPICNPTQVPWGKKAFEGYLGSVFAGKEYDAVELLKTYNGPKSTILIDQGTADKFLTEQLKPETLETVANQLNYPVKVRRQPGYDHSYYFLSTFIEDHISHHAKALGL